MEKVLFTDLSEKERIQMLSDNADCMEEIGYMKSFNHDEIVSMQAHLSELDIKIKDVEDAKKAANDDFRIQKKELQDEKDVILENIRNKAEYVREDCYKFCDHDEQMVGYYNSMGELVDSRPMRPDERQKTLFQVLRPSLSKEKTGTNND